MRGAFALLALLAAAALFSDANAAFCRQQAFKRPCQDVAAVKQNMIKDCKVVITVQRAKQLRNGCCIFPQKAANEADWKKYKQCEDTHPQNPELRPKPSILCSSLQTKSNC